MSTPPNDPISSLARHLSSHTIAPNQVQISQLIHRLTILQKWFPSAPPSQPLRNATILEIGCGQGDMTIALAHHLHPPSDQSSPSSHGGQILAIDPAPPDYGAPYTLGESQARISRSPLGDRIRWIRAEPRAFLSSARGGSHDGGCPEIDFVVLAHSVFYLPGEDYLRALLGDCLRETPGGGESRRVKLLVAEWGLRDAGPAGARAHVLAVRAQGLYRSRDGNVRCVVTPERFKELAAEAGWEMERDAWIESPELDDGGWEVNNLREMIAREGERPDAKVLIDEMEQRIIREGQTKAMDVWTAVFAARLTK